MRSVCITTAKEETTSPTSKIQEKCSSSDSSMNINVYTCVCTCVVCVSVFMIRSYMDVIFIETL